MLKRLSYGEMVQYVDNVLRPTDRGFTSEEINDQLFTFCANCPDPVAALDIVIETMGPVTAEFAGIGARSYASAPDVPGCPWTSTDVLGWLPGLDSKSNRKFLSAQYPRAPPPIASLGRPP